MTASLERTRARTRHRDEVEQQLINHRVALYQEGAARHGVEIGARLGAIAAESAREKSETMDADAREQPEQLREQAQALAEHDRLMAENAVRSRHVAAEQGLARLRGLHAEVRAQLARMLETPAAELGEQVYGRGSACVAEQPAKRAQRDEVRQQPRARPEG